ncbi:gliding motility-associated C-terminal domain-containing protein [Paracrocinitomix mangrovi]|uniref:T9SS type B sorting domain-containing protein n=1 Tax=Paracrocinitomix mangrovi TaxID=2862509 RepID=UPI001C8DD873|nr:gliding motility-associated C-terminal domain-containing protein [Paracrocinitomix mangrovi]UKN01622.1 gliding motility-associated C-terminal domain-containing protein [Paracrocinitomix mangrovi]
MSKSFTVTSGLPKLIAALFVLVLTSNAYSQIFLETFNEGTNSTQGTDNIMGVGWTATCTGSLDGNDYFKVVNGKLENQDSNGPAVWETSSAIDISGCDSIIISFDIEEDDDMEGCGTGCNAVDWVALEYNIDGGGWQTPANSSFCAGPCADLNVIQSDDIVGGSTNYSTGCFEGGNSILIRITTQTWSGTEHWRLDNITVDFCGTGGAPTVDAGADILTCNGASITLSATNPNNVPLSWSSGVTDGVQFTPGPGSNYYYVTAGSGSCTAIDSILITTVSLPNFSLTASPSSSCANPDGIITISGLSPGSDYELTYLDPNTVGPTTYTANGSGQIVLINMGPGFYSTWLLDSAGCYNVNTNGITVDPPIVPSVDAGNNQTVCEGTSVTLTADNPDNGTLTWTNGVIDGTPFTPGPGSVTYNVTTEISGCTAEDSVIVNVLADPNTTVDPAGPYGIGDGVQTLTSSPAGGTWFADCGACIDANTGEFDPAIAGIGSYNVCYVAGTAPCLDTACITVYVNDGCALTGTITSNPPSCYGFSDGSATINILFDNGAVTFTIEDSLGNQVNISNSNTANNLSQGWYYFTVVDETPCTFIDSVYLQAPLELDVDLNIIPPSCYGVLDGMAIADTVYNYTGSYNQISYVWAPNTGSNGIGEDTLSNAGGTGYTLLLTDENGCNATVDFDLPFPDSLYLSEFGSDPAYCRMFDYQSGNGVVYVGAAGGVPGYTYQWMNLEDSTTTANTTWGGLNPGTYQITVVDANGCVLVETIELDSLNPIADFDLSSSQFTAEWEGTAPVDVHFVNQSQYFANPNNPNADTTFFWDFGSGWVISHDWFEEFDTTYNTAGTYNVCLVAVNKNGCTDTACVPITIFDLQDFEPVNIFTPNNDNTNDYFSFEFVSTAISEFTCVIVNRWGIEVAQLNSITDTWDGTDKNGSKCKEGVYFYIYSGTADNGDTFKGQGTVQLIRD